MKKKEWKELARVLHKQSTLLSGRLNLTADEIAQLCDAVEFEARVAAKLSKSTWLVGCSSKCRWSMINPKDSINCIHALKAGFCKLRDARIAVEKEMDNE